MKYINLKRIEFVVTYHCTGKCRHCSVGDALNTGKEHYVRPDKATEAIQTLSQLFDIESVMTFGGEPLLYADIVCSIHNKAKECAIEKRQLITNGYFSKNKTKIENTVSNLSLAGVNDILLSVDSFHQEKIPIEPVRIFAEAALNSSQNIRLHPAWVVDQTCNNSYNLDTQRILNCFSDLNINISSGNNIFMSGNATKYLSDFYEKPKLDLSLGCGEMSYTSPLDNITSLSIEPNGDVKVCCFTIGNIYNEDIETIVKRYDPYKNIYARTILTRGIAGFIDFARANGVIIDTEQYYSVCEICRALMNKLYI